MPVTEQEKSRYLAFLKNVIEQLGTFQFDPELVLWHYTTGPALLGIVESGELFTTQVACLNDSTEVVYATRLYKEAMLKIQQERAGEEDVVRFISSTLAASQEDPSNPIHSPSKYFVSCFTTAKDDLSQWRAYSEPGGENGYAIGFRVRGLFVGPNSFVAKVNYDKIKHQEMARQIAQATLNFYMEGLTDKQRKSDPGNWAKDFFQVWDDLVYRIATLVKDPGFEAENEFRICHELQQHEIHEVRFRQKRTLLSRYMSLRFPVWMGTRKPMLPIAGVVVGPSRQREISAVSVRTLLRQMGYGTDLPVEISRLPLQSP